MFHPGFALIAAAGSGEEVQALRSEVDAEISKKRVELTQLVNKMLDEHPWKKDESSDLAILLGHLG